MASIYAKRGVLHISYWVKDYMGDRSRKTENLKLKDTRDNRRIAQRIKEEKEFELNKPLQKVLQHRLTLLDAEQLFLLHKKGVANKTKLNYKSTFRHFHDVVSQNTVVTKIEKEDVEKFKYYMKEELGFRHNTIASYIKDLKTFWNWLLGENYVSEKIVERVPLKENPIVTIPPNTFDEILKIFKKRNIKHYNFIMFLKLTGFRVSEAINLVWSDFDFATRRIKLKNQKGKRDDLFPLYPEVEKLVKSFPREGEKVFDFKNKDSTKFWNKEMKRLGYNYTLHSIRKTFATDLVNGKVSVFDAMKLLRHRNINTTMKYYTFVDLSRIGNEADRIFSKNEPK